jgi:hypothetical protein
MPIVDLEQIEKREQEELKQARDALDTELADVKNTSGEIPEKYRGKSLEEVIAMSEALERKASRLGNEVGQLRKLREQVDLTPQTRKIERKEVNVDALLENPEQAVETVIGQSEKIRELEEKVERIGGASARREFEKAYPNYEQDLANEEFIDWALKNPVRRALAQAADQYDFTAATELWGMWQERQELVGAQEKAKAEQKKAVREQKLRDGTLESGTGNSTETKKVFSRREIRDLKTRALQGDRAAEAIVNDPEWQRQTIAAYLDKRAR